MYEQVGQILAHYRSGKIPKAFKILPNLSNWEQVSDILYINQNEVFVFLYRYFSSHNQIDGLQHQCIKQHDYLHQIWMLKWLNGIIIY